MTRSPHDGEPFYCTTCSADLVAWNACIRPDCQLETAGVAQARRDQHLGIKRRAPGLTKRQRQILYLMRENGTATFFGDTRRFLHWMSDHGLVIKAYMTPELFLERLKLIEKVASNAPGTWYRLTTEGQSRADRISEMPS